MNMGNKTGEAFTNDVLKLLVLLGTENHDIALVESNSKWKADVLNQRETTAMRNPSLIAKIFA